MIKSVLVYIIKDDQVLLGKRKSKYAKNKWNGFGGKVEAGEELEQSAVREVYEECGLKIKEELLNQKAEIIYKEPNSDWSVIAYTINSYVGIPKETNEMVPKWFNIKNLPWEEMWQNDRIWLEKILKEGKKIKGFVENDEKGNVIKSSFSKI
jgi:8-oxo-dGTP pyrophosphatase MutT (NUDIX family)